MRKRVSWKIWYDDSHVVSSEESSWEDAPEDGVLIVMEYFPDEKQMVHMGADYYMMRDDTIIDFSLVHLDRHLKHGIPKGSMKFGRWATDEMWARVHEQVFGVEP